MYVFARGSPHLVNTTVVMTITSVGTIAAAAAGSSMAPAVCVEQHSCCLRDDSVFTLSGSWFSDQKFVHSHLPINIFFPYTM